MSFAELKPQVDALDHEEQIRLAAYLKHVLRKDDPAYQAELARRMDRMDGGHFHTQEDVARRRICAALAANASSSRVR